MAKPPRDHTSFGSETYFITANTCGRRPLFQNERMASLFITSLYHYREQKKFLLHEFVLMRDHFHLILTPSSIAIERVVQFVKGGFSYRATKELGLKSEIWGRGYVDHRIRDANDYIKHVEYTHQNPVRARLVNAAEHYPYSSAHSGFELDDCPAGLKPDSLEIA
jgi:putative transposase